MTSVTERLRELLDERGVEWHDTKIGKGFITVYEHDGITWIATEHSSGRLSVKGCVKPTQGHYDGMTPEQAIAATLGPGTCKIHDCEGSFSAVNRPVWRCDCGAFMTQYTDATTYHKPRFCPNCGRKVVSA